MQAVAGERIKSPRIPGWIDARNQHRPHHKSERTANAIAYLTEHMGEYIAREELAKAIGSPGNNIDSLLADIEGQDTPFVVWADEDRRFKSLMAVPREWM